MYILGINAYHGDVSAVLLLDGQVVAAVEEERYRRVKHWAGFPSMAIRACLDIAGISGSEVDHVAVSRDPRAHLLRKAWYVLKTRPGLDLLRDRLSNRKKLGDVETPLARVLGVAKLPPVHNVEHHPAHLASAFFVSPFEEAAVCAVDGFGDFVSTSLARGRGTEIDVLDRVFFPHSLGMLYTAVTQYLGFRNYGDEYKVMGLAPYGKPAYVDEIRQLVRPTDDGLFELDLTYFLHGSEGVDMNWDDGYPTLGRVFSDEMEALLGPARPFDGSDTVSTFHMDVAHSVQVVYEEAFLHVLNGLWERTRTSNLALAGGCAMNSVANGKIRSYTPFENLYIQPAAGDNGTALGAASHVWHELGGERRFVMDHAYWGPDAFSEASGEGMENISVSVDHDDWEFIRTARAHGDDSRFASERFETTDDTCREVARLLADGAVVGWYQGRMEWGARALGNRSILADPRRSDVRELINQKIKFRELFRPFAPAVLEEALQDYFVDPAPDAFMQQVYPVQPDKRAEIPAVTHVDGSGRLQSVSRTASPTFHKLISEFAALTDVPVLLNTSFNENEPIVATPKEALDCFLRTRMDVLVIGNLVVRRLPNISSNEKTKQETAAHAAAKNDPLTDIGSRAA
ncbi:MAG: carbamoyltransferase C-terminal domain-containing protein [Rhodothermales bacterium]